MTDSDTPSLDYYPPEIIYLIFRNLNGRSFLNCRKVCKKWKAIADNIGEDPELWKTFCHKDYKQIHKSVARKSVMPWYNIYKNILLWSKIRFAQERQSLQMMFTECVIRNMHVAKDVLIVVCNNGIKFYNIEDLYLITELIGSYFDCQENEYMNLILTQDRHLILYGKSSADTSFQEENKFLVSNSSTDLYRLEGNCCYFVNSKYELWGCKWEGNTWKRVFFARYYGCNAIKCLNVSGDEVYILTKTGAILKLLNEHKQFVKVESAWFPSYACTPAFLVNKCDIVYSTSADSRFQIRTDRERIEVECPNLSCLVVHANMLMVGTTNGEAEIYSWDNLRVSTLPERKIILQSLQVPDEIIAMDVFESEDEHTLFMSTDSSIYKITYCHKSLKAKQRMLAIESQEYDY